MNKQEIMEYLRSHENGRYEREQWDKFVNKRHFSLSCPVIHIAGTNGKGSTANLLANIYAKSGRKVGLFIKPFFYEVNEMFSINGVNISDEELEKIFNDNYKDFEKFDLSSFEIEVFIGYTYFNNHNLDLAIVECGMGGAMDATNLEDLHTVLSIITSISLEHTAYLGTTISKIALHKSGIVKDGAPLLVGYIDSDSKDDTSERLLREVAEEHESKYYSVDAVHHENQLNGAYQFDYYPYKNLKISTSARYMLKNAALAIEATKILQEQFPIEEEDLRLGLLAKNLPGRFERFGQVFIDGAHNPEAVSNLLDSYQYISNGAPVHVLFASFKDKNIAVEFPMLGKTVSSITLTTFDNPKARKEDDYFIYSGDYPFAEDWKATLKEMLDSSPYDVILIAGSLAFGGIVRKYLINGMKDDC